MNGQLLYNSFITPPVQISAEPTDINELAEYSNDPRVVTNLLDGINQTRDDVHMWLAPFTPGKNHIVRIRFYIPQALALIRIWVSHTGLAGGGGGGGGGGVEGFLCGIYYGNTRTRVFSLL